MMPEPASLLRHALFAVLCVPGVGCLGSDSDVGDLADESSETTGDDTADETGDQGEGTGALVYIHVRANDLPFEHGDGFAGQTPTAQAYGLRNFSLMVDRDDPAPQRIFDYGSEFVEASHDPGADTVVAMVPAADLEAGSYTHARVGLSHMRLTIDSTMHAMGLDLPGTFDIVHVLANGTDIDGTTRDRGWWRYVFNAAGQSFPLEGSSGGPSPAGATGGGIEVVEEGDETALYFPVALVTDPTVATDVHIVMEFNVDDSFRWEDEDGMNFAEGVFDATPTATEMIWRVGANAYEVYSE